MKNIQIFDGAENATFSVFQATNEEFTLIFPGEGQDIEFIEDFWKRIGKRAANINRAGEVLKNLWHRPIRRSDAMGIHGVLFYQREHRKKYFPKSKREIDTPTHAISQTQRELFLRLGGKPMPWKP